MTSRHFLVCILLTLTNDASGKQPAPLCDIDETHLSQSEKNTIIDEINRQRNRVASGAEEKYAFPSASGLLVTRWSYEAEAFAISMINKGTCAVQDCTRGCTLGDFEKCHVIADQVVDLSDNKPNLRNYFRSWYSQPELEKNAFNMQFVAYRLLMMLSQNSSQIGCVYYSFLPKESDLYVKRLVCMFCPGFDDSALYDVEFMWQMKNYEVYAEGRPCSLCPYGTACSSSYTSLCI